MDPESFKMCYKSIKNPHGGALDDLRRPLDVKVGKRLVLKRDQGSPASIFFNNFHSVWLIVVAGWLPPGSERGPQIHLFDIKCKKNESNTDAKKDMESASQFDAKSEVSESQKH